MKMIKNLALLSMIALMSSSVFAFDCEDIVLSDYDAKMNQAKEAFEKDLGQCFTLPFGEEFEECRYLSNQKYKKELKELSGFLFRGRKACMHDHTDYDLNNSWL